MLARLLRWAAGARGLLRWAADARGARRRVESSMLLPGVLLCARLLAAVSGSEARRYRRQTSPRSGNRRRSARDEIFMSYFGAGLSQIAWLLPSAVRAPPPCGAAPMFRSASSSHTDSECTCSSTRAQSEYARSASTRQTSSSRRCALVRASLVSSHSKAVTHTCTPHEPHEHELSPPHHFLRIPKSERTPVVAGDEVSAGGAGAPLVAESMAR